MNIISQHFRLELCREDILTLKSILERERRFLV